MRYSHKLTRKILSYSIQVDLDLPYLDKVRQAQARERNTDYSFLRRVMELG